MSINKIVGTKIKAEIRKPKWVLVCSAKFYDIWNAFATLNHQVLLREHK